MDKLSLRLPSEDLVALESWGEENGLSRGAAARECIQSALERARGPSEDDRIRAAREPLEAEIADLESELERAKREKRMILDQREEHRDLVAVVERDQTLAERRAEAGALTRLRWWATGMPDE